MTLAAIEYRERTDTWQTPGGRPVSFVIREETNDWNTVNSCLNDEYHLGTRTFATFIDVGGYVGAVGISVAVDNPDCRVLIVEPVPENADLCERNAALNGVSDRVTVFRGSVGPKGETTSEVRFRYVGDFSLEHHAFVGNSSLAYDDGGKTQHESLEVETLGLTALLDRFGFDEPDMLKIDCEGAEWDFLTAPKTALRRLPEIVGELHPTRGHVPADLVKMLPTHDVTFDGPESGPCLFRAVRK